MKLARSVPIILAIILALTAFDSPRAAAQTDCARAPIDMSTLTGSWSSASDCHSPNRPIDPEGPGDGIYYAGYYDFYVSQTSEVTITLESSTDPYLYLLIGAGRDGEILAQNDDIDYDVRNLNSRITKTLEPGDYSIEATTYAKEATGEFTLTVEGINFAVQRDRAALIALYNATNGPNWTQNDNWLSHALLSEWHGIDTDAEGRVTHLNLADNNLSGIIPADIAEATSLTSISISGNQLTGELPSELTQLGNLDTLYFQNNAGLCAPAGTSFQTWLQSIDRVNGETCGEDTPPTPMPTPSPTPAPTPSPVPSECSEHIANFATFSHTLTNACTSENRTAFGNHYARNFTFTLSHPTTVEVLLRSQFIDTYIFLIDDEGETIVDTDDYIGRNAGFRKALQPGAYTIEATTFRSDQIGDFTITFSRPEFDALKALYESAGGADWARKDNWLSSAPLSEWQGIQTDSEGRVIQINLIANNLTGEIPSELQDLIHLDGLYLSKNDLSGTIPRELGSLSALQVLLLSDNNLTGRIPEQLGNLENLKELYLSLNQLSGPIPATLGKIEDLYKLHLAANELSGRIPAELANLSSLRTLSIAANELSGPIPYQLTDMENLTHIYLWGNDLSEGSFVRYLGDLESLEFLDIGGNDIDGAEVLAELDGLPNLTGIGLHDSGLADADLLRYMDDLQALNLEFLNLRGNGLSDLQILVGLSRITTLQRIAINDNDFSGQLPRSMTALTLMRLFYFHDNDGLCAPDDSEFQDWLRGSPEIREFLRGGYPDVKGPTCTNGTTPANAPVPTSNSADQFAAVLHARTASPAAQPEPSRINTARRLSSTPEYPSHRRQ